MNTEKTDFTQGSILKKLSLFMLPVLEARRLPLHMYSVSRETSPQRVSRLLEADGSLLFIVQVQYERHDTGNGAQSPKDRQIEAFKRFL